MAAGASVRSCFCGPCFGAGDVPANGGLLHPPLHPQLPQPGGQQAQRRPAVIRGSHGCPLHRRHGSSTAASSPGADELPAELLTPDRSQEPYTYDDSAYKHRVYYRAWAAPEPDTKLQFGPNIADWPQQVRAPGESAAHLLRRHLRPGDHH